MKDIVTAGRRVAVIDAMDEALDIVRTCALALGTDSGLLEASAIESITSTLNTAIWKLGRVRAAINEDHGRS